MNHISYKQLQDAAFRAKLKKNPTEVLNKYGVTLSKDAQIKVLSNTKNTYFVVFPNTTMEYDDLTKLQAAANSVGSVGTVGSFACLGSFCTTAGSVGSFGTVGSAGTVDTRTNTGE